MEYDFKVDFLVNNQIKIIEKKTLTEATFQYYADNPEIYMISCYFGKFGIEWQLMDEFYNIAANEIKIEQYLADYEENYEICQRRLQKDLEELRKISEDAKKISEQQALEFFLQRDLKLIAESPAEFFQPLDIKKMLPDDQEDYSGTQFYRSHGEAEEHIPQSLRRQLKDFYRVEYSWRLGYPMILFKDCVREDVNFYTGHPGGIIFVDPDHVYGIIQFDNLKKGFFTEWNNSHKAQAIQIYGGESNKSFLVKKLIFNNGKISDDRWTNFFSIYPCTVIRQYNDFLKK